ncbi:MAG: hypothetical protein HKN68_11250 [Saprospiraceae bacterium]|nr:hypothetical protein [Saprospiraceae bacterium]
MANVLDVILKTIEDVQNKNQRDPRQETADPSIFDLIKKEVAKLDNKVKNNELQKGKRNPKSILDMIRDGIDGVRKQNKKDPNVPTAPKTVFDDLLKKVDRRPQRQASAGIKRVIEEYNLDISRLHPDMIRQIQAKYQNDMKNMNQQYAQAIYNLIKQTR